MVLAHVLDYVAFVVPAIAKLLVHVLSVLFSPITFLTERVIYDGFKKRSFSSVLITGASSGIGAEFARQFASRGARVVLVARRKEKLEALAEECRALGAQADVAIADVSDKEALEKLINDADEKQELDLVIANAGINRNVIGARNVLASAQKTFEVNLFGVFNTVFPAVRLFKKRRRGHICMVSSLAGYCNELVEYSWAKRGVTWFGEYLRPLMHKVGVGVTVIAPGYVTSEMTEAVANRGKKKRTIKGIIPTSKGVRMMIGALERNVGQFAFPLGTNVLSQAFGQLDVYLNSVRMWKSRSQRFIDRELGF